MNICVATCKSMTEALRASKILNARGIGCQVVNLDPSVTKNGCAYGVSFGCADTGRVRRILDSGHIPYGQIIGER